MSKVLFVLSSHADLGDTGRPTGYLLSEASVPWKILTDAGIEVAFVSPKGGKAAQIGDVTEAVSAPYVEAFGPEGPDTMTPEQVEPAAYDGIFYVGGHGPMWDFVGNPTLPGVTAAIWEGGGVVAGVCHGPAGLLDVELSDGTPLVSGRRVSAMPDELESQKEVVPFLLAAALTARGALHEPGERGAGKVCVDGKLITGQDPSSCEPLAVAIVEALVASELS